MFIPHFRPQASLVHGEGGGARSSPFAGGCLQERYPRAEIDTLTRAFPREADFEMKLLREIEFAEDLISKYKISFREEHVVKR